MAGEGTGTGTGTGIRLSVKMEVPCSRRSVSQLQLFESVLYQLPSDLHVLEMEIANPLIIHETGPIIGNSIEKVIDVFKESPHGPFE